MIKLAILGFGIVGSGVATLLTENADVITQSAGQSLSLKSILDLRDLSSTPYSTLQARDFNEIESDPEIQIVVECMGGKGVALEFTKRALEAGKSVVTSNKELIAYHGHELFALAKKHNAHYLFEASVGGGIPIIHPLRTCLTGNHIEEIYGILNGTTNYMLTEMANNNLSFDAALKQAQELGYAESDPSADVEGDDAARKIAILSSLAFGTHISPDSVFTTGIRNVHVSDIQITKQAGYHIKLLGHSKRLKDGSALTLVSPHLIPRTHLLSQIEGVQNAVCAKGNAVGEVLFYGPGAGKRPTASAIIADVISIATNNAPDTLPWTSTDDNRTADFTKIPQKWYVRCPKGGAQSLSWMKTLTTEHPDETACITAHISHEELKPKLDAAEAFCAIPVLEL